MLRKIKSVKKSNNSTISSVELGNLYFGQLNVKHQIFFDKLYGQHTRLRLRDLPHYIFWRDEEYKNPKKSQYCHYLKESWGYYYPKDNTEQKRLKKIEDYIRLQKDIKKHGVKIPLQILVAPDGAKVIVSGNHRASIAYSLGINVPVEYVGLEDYLKRTVLNENEFYGTKNKGIPYQSIFFYSEELLKGRRRDIFERFNKIDIADIRGKKVLDSGSNIAMSCMLAWQYGAKSATAGEFSPQIGTSALRLSTVIGAEIDVLVQDWGKPITDLKSYDTVFSFSLYAHVKDKINYEKNLVKATKNVLYFEGHQRSTEEDYEHIFRHFKNVKFLGYNQDGIQNRESTRPFFRCEK